MKSCIRMQTILLRALGYSSDCARQHLASLNHRSDAAMKLWLGALVGIISIFIQPALAGWDFVGSGPQRDNAVDVAELCKSRIPEAIVISHDPPNEGRLPKPVIGVSEDRGDLRGRFGSRRQNDAAITQWANYKAIGFSGIKVDFLTRNPPGPCCAVPTHIPGGQAPYISKCYGAHHAVALVMMGHESAQLYSDIGTLNDFGIARGIANATSGDDPQTYGGKSENGGEHSEDGRVERHWIVRRPPPEGFEWIFGGLLFLGGLLGLGIVWKVLRR
jgi:hypothetical protein